MDRYLACVSGLALVLAATGCGGAEELATNVAVENDLTASGPAGTAIEPEAPTPAPAPPTAEQRTAPKPAAPKPAAPKPAPAKPKSAEPAPDPHAGHDMNNMQY